MDLAEQVRAGDRRALAQAITLIESTREDHRREAEALLEVLLPHTGNSIRLGISGVPGVGKSTFIEALGQYLIDDGHRVAVLAVDPSSPYASLFGSDFFKFGFDLGQVVDWQTTPGSPFDFDDIVNNLVAGNGLISHTAAGMWCS